MTEQPQKLKNIAKVRAILRALLLESWKDEGPLQEKRRILLIGMLHGIVWSRGGDGCRTLKCLTGDMVDTSDLDAAVTRVDRVMRGEMWRQVYGKDNARGDFADDLERWADWVALRVANCEPETDE